MYLTSGAKVSTRRSRAARSLVARYSFHRARISSDVARRDDVGAERIAVGSLEGGRRGRWGYRPCVSAPTSPFLGSQTSSSVELSHPQNWGYSSAFRCRLRRGVMALRLTDPVPSGPASPTDRAHAALAAGETSAYLAL